MRRQPEFFGIHALFLCAILSFFSLGSSAQDIGTSPTTIAAQIDTAETRKHTLTQRIGDTLGTYFRAPLPSKPLSWKAIVIPTALIGYGTLSFTSDWARDVNIFGRRFATGNGDPDRETRIDDYTQHIPALSVVGLNIGGIRGRNNLLDATLLYGMSSGIAGGIVIPLKRFTDTHRPDSSDILSFPSGHTATAFISAEFLRQEYKHTSPWIGVAGYAMAVATGYLRMYNNKHWFSDVMAGAGIGILSTRISYWLYPKMKNLIIRKPTGHTMILPTFGDGYVGFSMVKGF
jgi:membrane-associated phospholipid phosphatase